MKVLKITELLSAILTVCLTGILLCPCAAAQSQSGKVVSAALSQVGYTERSDEFTQFGQWFGISKGYWCDMFVSWCADQAGVPREIFPPSASCTAHVRLFTKKGQYVRSAARGGNALPQQGDLIFFYDPICDPDGRRLTHVGLVLYTENGRVYTVEGNALTNRTDCAYQILHENHRDKLDPDDYVAVNSYSLDAPQIHGYAVPAYTSREALALDGFVDLGRFAAQHGQFRVLCDEGVMASTSSHTFSPRGGMSRGEFLSDVLSLYGLSGWTADTTAFSDVPESSPWYAAVMTARCAGIVQGTGENCFRPDAYISGPSAQAILSGTLAYIGMDGQTFSFSSGDQSYICGDYTIRADLAQALWTLRGGVPLPKRFDCPILLDSQDTGWDALQINGACCVPLETLQKLYPSLCAVQDTAGTSVPDVPAAEQELSGGTLPVPFAYTQRVCPAALTLQNGEKRAAVTSFRFDGKEYVALRETAALLPLEVQWNSAARTVELRGLTV